MELAVHAGSRGLLMLSETFYPGWRATVNGQPARILEVDGVLRGILVDAGDSHVTLQYRPWSVLVGAILTASAFLGTALAWRLLAVHRG